MARWLLIRNDMSSPATQTTPRLRAAAAAQAAVAGSTPGTLEWVQRLLGWWASLRPERPSARLFTHLLRQLGVPAQQLHLDGPRGTHRVLVQARLGPGSQTTSEWAVVDPDRPHVFTAPDGRMAHPDELRRHPDWVAGDRSDDAERTSPGTSEWMFWARGPRAINFQIGDACNMHCVMCWNDLRRSRDPREKWYPEMTAAAIAATLEEHLESIDSVELVSYGEPMANPQFDEIVHAIDDLGQRRGRPFLLHVVTNGSLLHRRRHIDVLRQPGDLTFSIDAPDEAIFEAIREGGSWRDVVGNLRAAVRHDDRHPGRKIGINMTVFEPNLGSVFAMGAFAAGLDLDYLSILHGIGLDGTRAAGREIDNTNPLLADQIERIRRTFPWLRLNDYATGRTLPPLPNGTLPDRTFCPLPWRQFDIGQDGRAHPCCRSYSTDLGAPSDAWLGEPMTELRRQILAGDLDRERFSDCTSCPNLGIPDSGRTHRRVIPLKAV
jgi:MoaA/NifB/PqqE/SkfB family radical SAM enzyme